MILMLTGHPRSGTTMLRSFCNRHPDITVTHEFGNFLYWQRPYAEHQEMIWDRFHTVGARWGYVKTFSTSSLTKIDNWRFTKQYLKALKREVGSEDDLVTAEKIDKALNRVFKKSVIVGDKLPQYRNRLDEFIENEQVRCLLIYRDCRDVTSSFLKKKRTEWKGNDWAEKFDSAGKVAARWAADMEKMEQFNGRALIIRYEDLVQKPETVVPEIANWLNVSVAGFNQDLLSAKSIGKYKQGLTADELDEVMEAAGATMAQYGYE